MKKKLNVLVLGISERITYTIELLLLSNKNINNVTVVYDINWAKDVLSTKKIDVVILDSKFSDNEGLFFLKHIKELFPAINTIILTTCINNFHKSCAIKLGINYFIDKSMAYQELPKILSRINTHSQPSLFKKRVVIITT